MNYKNANKILPDRLVQEIQQYVQGEYIYIPIKDKVINVAPTEYEQELMKRNKHIFTKSLEGVSNRELADMYHLSVSSIRRIIIEQRKGYESMNHKVWQIINEWDIEEKEAKQIYDSAWQVGEYAVLKIYKDVNMLQRNIKILSILEDFEGYEQKCKLQLEEKQAVPYVMESIELLFAAWFMKQNDIKCVEDAMRIYQFVGKNIGRILKTIGCR